MRRITSIEIAGLCCLLALGVSIPDSTSQPLVREELLYEMNPALKLRKKSTRASPDGSRIAWNAKRGGKWLMVVNGLEGPEFDEIGLPVFSPDGKSLAYTAKRKNKWFVLNEGQEGPEFDMIDDPVFSLDSKHLVYIARKWKWISSSMIVAKPRLVVDGKEGPEFYSILPPTFSPDGNHLAYVAERDNNMWVLIVDEQEGTEFEGRLGSPAFSPDGRHLAYAVNRAKNKWVLMVDGQEGPEFEAILTAPVFSHDSQHIAYAAWDKKTSFIMLDKEKLYETPAGKGWNFVETLIFSPDNQHLAYVVGHGGVGYMMASKEGREHRARSRVVVDGQEGKEYNVVAVDNLQFSLDSQRLAYELHDIGKGKSVVVAGAQEGKLYDEIVRGTLSFSSMDSVTYIAREGLKFYRVRQPVP